MKINKSNLLLILLIDILFLPFLKPLPIKISMIILPVFFLFKFKEIMSKEKALFLGVSLLTMILSLLFGIFYFYNDIPLNDYLNNNLIEIVSFFNFILLIIIFKDYNPNKLQNTIKITRVIKFYLIFTLAWALIHWTFPQLSFNLRIIWSFDSEPIQFSTYFINRFTSVFNDPNNFAFVIIFLYLFLYYNKTNRGTLLYYLISTFLIITSLSSTGVITWIVISSILMILSLKCSNYKVKINLKPILALLIVIIFVVTVVDMKTITKLLFSRTDHYLSQGNISGGRLNIWKNYLQNDNILKRTLFGTGGNIDNGVFIKPHNGHLHIIYNFGFVFYLVFFFNLLKSNKNKSRTNFLHLISLLIVVTMNTLFIDFKASIIILILYMFSNKAYTKKEYNTIGEEENSVIQECTYANKL